MRIDIRYFAAAREAAGREAETLDVVEGATVSDLRVLLVARHAALEGLGAGLRYAVGEQFASPEDRLAEGDVVALIPPVSGG